MRKFFTVILLLTMLAPSVANASQDIVDIEVQKINELITKISDFEKSAKPGRDPGCVDADNIMMMRNLVQRANQLLEKQYYYSALVDMREQLEECLTLCKIKPIKKGEVYYIRCGELYVQMGYDTGVYGRAILLPYNAGRSLADWKFLPFDDGSYALQCLRDGCTLGCRIPWQYMDFSRYKDVCRFFPEYVGNGEFKFKMVNWAGEFIGYLENYKDNAVFCNDTGGSTFTIEEIHDHWRAELPSCWITKKGTNKFEIRTCPIGISNMTSYIADFAAFKVRGFCRENQDMKLVLKKVNFHEHDTWCFDDPPHGEHFAPGEPALILFGDHNKDFDPTWDEEYLIITFNDSISRHARITEGGLAGVMTTTDSVTIEGEHLRVDNNTGKLVYESKSSRIANFSGYIAIANEVKPNDGDVVVTIPGVPTNALTDVNSATSDNINNTLESVSGSSVVYDLNGRVVSQSGSLVNINQLGKGTYIVNGVKVMVR